MAEGEEMMESLLPEASWLSIVGAVIGLGAFLVMRSLRKKDDSEERKRETRKELKDAVDSHNTSRIDDLMDRR
jgi:hypothetical protein